MFRRSQAMTAAMANPAPASAAAMTKVARSWRRWQERATSIRRVPSAGIC